ncbi:restriction endonuclease subunit S [Chloroflexales bacterium ZM16-3]|nr:restriction endonuclease subunit S [Chloroflexales bacterium ZM16-3]
MIPEEWSVSKVGVEFDIQLGKMLDAEKNTGVLKPYLGNKAVQWNVIDVGDLQMMAMSRSDLERFRLRHGDLLVCEGGEVGRSAIWEDQIEECYYQKALHRLRPLRGFNPRLMIEILRYWTDQGMLANYVTQTSIAHLTREKFAEVPIPVPSTEEQDTIAAALSDVDALLAALDALITKKRDIKQATMQQLLTSRTRLPGFSGEWAVINMASDAILKARIGWQGLTTAEYLEDGDYYLVTGTDFVNGRVDWSSCCFVDKSRYLQDKHIQLKDGDVLLTKDGTIGKVGYVDHLPAPSTLNSGIFVIRPKNEKYESQYLYYVMTSSIFDGFLERLQAGSTISHLYQKDFVNFSFLAPPPIEQTAIADVLSDMDAEIAALERRRAKTQVLKQGMMQELLTGKTRLV